MPTATLRKLMRYGRHVGIANVLDYANASAEGIIVGRALGASALGYFSVAKRLASMPVSVLGNILGRGVFAAFARLQHDIEGSRKVWLDNVQRLVTGGDSRDDRHRLDRRAARPDPARRKLARRDRPAPDPRAEQRCPDVLGHCRGSIPGAASSALPDLRQLDPSRGRSSLAARRVAMARASTALPPRS